MCVCRRVCLGARAALTQCGCVGQAFSVLCHEALMHACTMGLKVPSPCVRVRVSVCARVAVRRCWTRMLWRHGGAPLWDGYVPVP